MLKAFFDNARQAGNRRFVLSEALLPLRPLAYLVLFHLFFSGIVIGIFARSFGYGRRVMLLHLLLVFAFICLLVIFLCGVAAIKALGIRLIRLISSVTAAFSFMFLLLLYLANFISNHYTGDNVSYEMAVNNIFHLDSLLLAINIRPMLAYLIVILFFLAISVVYFALSKYTLGSLDHLVRLFKQIRLFSSLRRALVGVGITCALLAAYAGGIKFLSSLVPGVGATRSEPILSLLTPTVPNSKAKLLSQEELVRKQYSAPQKFQRKNVVLITVDSLRADHVPLYGYERDTTPFLSSLMKQGHLSKVDFASANCPASRCGIMSILTSRFVEELRPGNLGLYDILYDLGYKVYLILSGDHSGFPDLKLSYGNNIDFYFDGASSRRYAPNDDHVLFEGLARVPSYFGTPTFFFFHLMSGHSLGPRFDGFDRFQPAMKEMDVGLFHNYDSVSVNNEYDNRVLQCDDVLRQLFEALGQKGYLQNALVIVLADHGQGLGEHNIFGHGRSLYEEGIHIPFLIYDPDDAQFKGLDSGSQIDVAPTIFDRLGLPVPSVWRGHSVYRSVADDSYHRLWKKPYCAAAIKRIDKARFKYIYCEETRKEELYELITDPKERQNLITTADTGLVNALRSEVVAHGVAIQ